MQQLQTAVLFLLVGCPLYWPAVAGEVQRIPSGLREIDRTDRYEVLDRWRERVGIGPASTVYEMRKVRERGTGRIQVYGFTSDGQPADRRPPARQVAPRDKIDPLLMAAFDRPPHPAQLTTIVWLVDRQSRTRRIAEQSWITDQVEQGAEITGPVKSPPAATSYQEALRGIEFRTLQQRSRIANGNSQTVQRFLQAAAVPVGDVVYRFSQAPAVAIRVSRQNALRIAARQDVRFLFADRESFDELPIVRQAVLAPEVNLAGEGVKVAVVGESAPFAHDNPFLTGTIRCSTIPPNAHATAVAGIIASTHGEIRGIAVQASLLSACRHGSPTEASIDEAADWALAQGAMILNCSQGFSPAHGGQLSWSDIYADYLVHNSRVLFVKSAGNSGPEAVVTSPGRGFNSLCVGNVEDNSSASWQDDVMHGLSNAENPDTGTDKPEIASHGSFIRSTKLTPPWVHQGVGATGTSYAAAMVAGIGALGVNRAVELADEPQALKAMIMASGLARDVDELAGVSEFDGAGAALATAACVGYHVLTVRATDFEGGVFELPIPIPLEYGQTERVVLVYSHPPISEDADPLVDSYLRSDLDLELYAAGKLVGASNFSGRNPFELIDHVPNATNEGTLKIRLVAWHPDVQSLRVGIAYTKRSTLGEPPIDIPGTCPPSAKSAKSGD